MLLLPSRCPLPVNRIVHADALAFLRGLPDGCVHCVVTSPPYFGLRDYGVSGQIGLEDTPQAFVAKMVELFREVKRVLRDDGVAWVNMGDSYASGEVGRHDKLQAVGLAAGEAHPSIGRQMGEAQRERSQLKLDTGLRPKNLLGIPWRVAFGLQDDGWILRSDVIWHKPNPMPESVTDRPTKSHEQVFLLAKSEKYFYDQEAIREPAAYDGRKDLVQHGSPKYANGFTPTDSLQSMAVKGHDRWQRDEAGNFLRNKRTVWTVATEPTPFAHFATFPQKLIEPMILAGCPHKVCAVCGAPWERVVEREGIDKEGWGAATKDHTGNISGSQSTIRNGHGRAGSVIVSTLGFAPNCTHADAPTRPGIVLDPFMGSGTVALVAQKHNRRYMGCDLNAEYVEIARMRVAGRIEEYMARQAGQPYSLPLFSLEETL